MRTEEKSGTGRFPVPREKWILDQLPEEVTGFFGFRGENTPDRFGDLVDYYCTIKYPDGSTLKYPVLVHYLAEDGVPVVFIIGETVELDGIPFKVVDYDSKRHTECTDAGDPFTYTYWEVRVTPARKGSCD